MASARTPVSLDEFCRELGYSDSSGFYNFSEPVPDLPPSVEGMGEKLGIDAVFGTYQGPNQRFKPVVYFKESSHSEDLKQVYNNIWNEGLATLLIVVFDNRVKVYNCTQKPVEDQREDLDDYERLLDTLDLYKQSLEEISSVESYGRPNIESRKFWKEHHGEFSRENRVDQHLLKNLERLKDDLTGNLPLSYANSLIIRSLFLLYLDDRNVIQESFYQHNFGRSEYREVLQNKEDTYALFDEVKRRLNGDIFEYNGEEFESVTEEHLQKVRRFLMGTNLETNQARLFPYRFDLIPIELISSIYEHFVGESDTGGTYYTRPEMADYMIDELLTEEIHKRDRIVDPACGSGIFLVSAFSRLVENERSSSGQVELDTLLSFLTDRLYGYDNNPQAIQITAFSLYLKLLEYVDNSDLWEDGFELPSLIGDSILNEDFFEVPQEEKYDLVIGNPPWGYLSQIDSAAESYLEDAGYPIGNSESAQAFIWKAYDHIKDKGEVCFAVPARSLLFHTQATVVEFREKFFNTASVRTIANLAPLRKSLFENATNPAAIVTFGKNENRNQRPVQYITPKSFNVDVLRSIPVDTNHDVKHLSPEYQRFDYVWKTGMWGGKADLDLMSRLDSLPTIGNITEGRDLKTGTGFQASSTTRDQKHVPSLANLPHLETGRVEPYHVPEDDLVEYDDGPYFRHPGDPALYDSPIVTVRATATLRNDEPGASRGIKAAFHDQPVSYRSRIVGIVGGEEDKDILRLLTLVLNSSIAQYWLFLSTVGWGVARPAIRQDEILSVPFPLNELKKEKEKLLEHEYKIRELISNDERGEEYRKQIEQVDELLFDSYGLSEVERNLVESRVSTSIDFYHERQSSDSVSNACNKLLQQYGEIVCAEINKFLRFSDATLQPIVYDSDNSQSPLNLLTLQLTEGAGETQVKTEHAPLEEKLRSLDSQRETDSLYHRRIVEIYDENSIHVIKPDEVRFWSVAEAINDAPEMVGELIDRA